MLDLSNTLHGFTPFFQVYQELKSLLLQMLTDKTQSASARSSGINKLDSRLSSKKYT